MRSQFSSREAAYQYNRSVKEITAIANDKLEKAKELMSNEDFKEFENLVNEPIRTMREAELMVKYGMLNPKHICPTKPPV